MIDINKLVTKLGLGIVLISSLYCLSVLCSCGAKQESKNKGNEISVTSGNTIFSLNNIALGMSRAEVIRIRGNEYTEISDFNDMIGDSIEIFKYEDGLEVEFLRSSDKVCEVRTRTLANQTNLGCRVGDTFKFVHQKYVKVSAPYFSRSYKKDLPGWYRNGRDILIFDPIVDDDRISYENISDTSRVEQIILISEGSID